MVWQRVVFLDLYKPPVACMMGEAIGSHVQGDREWGIRAAPFRDSKHGWK